MKMTNTPCSVSNCVKWYHWFGKEYKTKTAGKILDISDSRVVKLK
jgi:hypothetical protein